MTLTDDVIQQFADAKNAQLEGRGSGDGGEGEASEVSEDTSAESAASGGDGSGGAEEDGEAAGGDPSVDQSPAPTDPVVADDDAGATVPTDPVEAIAYYREMAEKSGDPAEQAAYWRRLAESEEKRRRDTQAHTDRQLAEARTKIEALEQLWTTEDAEYEAQQAAQAQQLPDQEQLDAWVSVAPRDAFLSVLQNAPDKMGDLIASVGRVHGPDVAREARDAYADALREQRLAEIEQGYKKEIEAIRAPAQQAQEFKTAIESVRSRYPVEEIESLKPRISELIRSNYDSERQHYASTEKFIEAQFLLAYREQAVSAATQQASASAVAPPAPHVETGGGTKVVVPEKSYEQIKAEKLRAAYENGSW